MKYLSLFMFIAMLASWTSLATAREFNAKVEFVEDFSAVPGNSEYYSPFEIGFSSPGTLNVSTIRSGGCSVHDYTLYVSEKLQETNPPTLSSRLTVNTHNDTCDGTVTADLVFDLSPLGLVGPHFVAVDWLDDKQQLISSKSILVDFAARQESAMPQVIPLMKGEPKDFGDMLTALNSADVIAGVDSYQLRVLVEYSGGCEEHSFSAYWDGSFVKTNPPRARIILVHDDNGDVCRMLVTEELHIDLSDLIPATPALFIDVKSINMEPVTAVFP